MINIDSYEENIIRLRALIFTYKDRKKMNITYCWNGFDLKIKASFCELEASMIEGIDVSNKIINDIKKAIKEIWTDGKD